ncbi:MAG: hypothetical protein Q4B28_02005 [bacterium]|nr:hypothetical protein [bacterium]
MTGGFVIKQLSYLDKQGLYTEDRKRANNSFFLAQKTVFLGA